MVDISQQQINATVWTVHKDLPSLVIKPPGELQDDKYIDGFILGINNGNRGLQVSLIMESWVYSLELIHRELVELMPEARVRTMNPVKNSLVIVSFGTQRMWYRGLIIARLSPSDVNVMLIDHGSSEIVDIRQLYDMPEPLKKYPALAFPVCTPQSFWVGKLREELQTRLRGTRVTALLSPERTTSKCFEVQQLWFFSKAQSGVLTVEQALSSSAQLIKRDFSLLYTEDKSKAQMFQSFPSFTPTDDLKRIGSTMDKNITVQNQDMMPQLNLQAIPEITQDNSKIIIITSCITLAIAAIILGICGLFYVLFAAKHSRSSQDSNAEKGLPKESNLDQHKEDNSDFSERVSGGKSQKKDLELPPHSEMQPASHSSDAMLKSIQEPQTSTNAEEPKEERDPTIRSIAQQKKSKVNPNKLDDKMVSKLANVARKKPSSTTTTIATPGTMKNVTNRKESITFNTTEKKLTNSDPTMNGIESLQCVDGSLTLDPTQVATEYSGQKASRLNAAGSYRSLCSIKEYLHSSCDTENGSCTALSAMQSSSVQSVQEESFSLHDSDLEVLSSIYNKGQHCAFFQTRYDNKQYSLEKTKSTTQIGESSAPTQIVAFRADTCENTESNSKGTKLDSVQIHFAAQMTETECQSADSCESYYSMRDVTRE